MFFMILCFVLKSDFFENLKQICFSGVEFQLSSFIIFSVHKISLQKNMRNPKSCMVFVEKGIKHIQAEKCHFGNPFKELIDHI